MRELEHDTPTCAVVGPGRAGHALAAALRRAGWRVEGPLGRGADPHAEIVLLAVPDGEIAAAAAALTPRAGTLVGHCSGATGLEPLAPHEAFSAAPVMTMDGAEAPLAGAACLVDGATPRARQAAERLARAAGMRPARVERSDRTAYHAAASLASNYLLALEDAAERLAATAGLDRADLAPLVRATLERWATAGPAAALTGPIVRGDEATVAAQRAAVAERAPDALPLWDTLAAATRELAGGSAERAAAGRLRTVRTVAGLRAMLRPHRDARARIGLVPTMGALHEGHLSLIRRARQGCDVVVVSLFVNPAQFGPHEDLAAYPRDEARDARLAAAAGADILFAPPVEEVYPAGFATTVHIEGLTDVLEGAARPGHFDGVTTVVSKLLNLVRPDAAYFGQKDAQQALVVRRLVKDLDLGTRIEVCPIVREPDGLAMSSRNAYLGPRDRARAVALKQGLDAATAALQAGERDAARVEAAARAAMAEHDVEPEYLALVDPDTLAPRETVEPGELLIAVAARVGPARLIDNTLVRVGGSRHPETGVVVQCSA